jgi:hypothetical protein
MAYVTRESLPEVVKNYPLFYWKSWPRSHPPSLCYSDIPTKKLTINNRY